MFRPPMRLEKWIAFDGALGSDVLEAATHDSDTDSAYSQDSAYSDFVSEDGGHDSDAATNDANDGTEDVAFFAERFFMPLSGGDPYYQEFIISNVGGNATASIGLPGSVDTTGADPSGLLLFWDHDDVHFHRGSGSFTWFVSTFYFELRAGQNGAFSFLDYGDVQGKGQAAHNAYLTGIGLADDDNVGEHLVFGTNHNRLVFMRIAKNGLSGNYYLSVDYSADGKYRHHDGALRFSTTNSVGHGNETVEMVLKSLVYTPNSAYPTTIDDYTISIFHDRNRPNSDLVYANPNDPRNIYINDNLAMSNDPKYNGGGGGDGGGGGEGEDDGGDDDTPPINPNNPGQNEITDPDLEPEQPIAPVVPSTPPPSSQPGDIGQGPSFEIDLGDGQNGDAESGEAGAEQADGGNAIGNAALNVAYHHEEEEDFGEATAQGHNNESALESRDDSDNDADAAFSTDALAAPMELVRDMELLLSLASGKRMALIQALQELQNAYFSKNSGDWGELRPVLQKIFDAGVRERDGISRIVGEMNALISRYKSMDAERLDGLLTEGLRELGESAELRTGEANALAHAIRTAAGIITSKDGNAALPTADELLGGFERAHADAVAKWQAQAERLDGPGKELLNSDIRRTRTAK